MVDVSKLLTVEELAERLGVHPATVRRWYYGTGPAGIRLPRVRIGRKVYLTLEDYQKWQGEVDRQPAPTRAPAVSAAERKRGYREAVKLRERREGKG